MGPEEMDQLRALLMEALGSIFTTHMAVYKPSVTTASRDMMSSSDLCGHQTCIWYTYKYVEKR